jgi:NAD(P)H-hydrate epimerase
LITLFAQPDTYVAAASQLQSPMVTCWTADTSFDRFTALLVGPGLAAADLPAALPEAAAKLWRSFTAPLVVDASALEWLPPGSLEATAVRVITPHPGEAARLLGVTTKEVQADRVGTVRRLSRKFGGCWVVLKGHQTMIGADEGHVYVNSTGCPGLAQGGSGDVLSGYLAGWLAQPLIRTEPLEAIRYAVWEHGAAADRLDRVRENWIVEELAVELGRAVT